MPYKPDQRVYRSMELLAADPSAPAYHARGYASTFERYLLFEDIDGPVYEQILPTAFDHANMSDVILQFDHMGRPYARTSNNTLLLSVDGHGLKVDADLSLTDGSRELWQEINCGLITRMSFCFIIGKGHFDQATSTSVIEEISKVFDVSAVSIPANPGTDIEARCAYDGEIIRARAERRGKTRRLQCMITLDLLGGKHGKHHDPQPGA